MIECQGCGCPEPTRLSMCPYCGADKCDACDMGDDVECGSCYDDMDDVDLDDDWDGMDDDWDEMDDIDF